MGRHDGVIVFPSVSIMNISQQTASVQQATLRTAPLRLVIALGVTQTIAWASSYYLATILATPMARDLGISRAEVFAALSMALLIAGLCGPAAGRWIDRRGGRGMLCLSNAMFAASLLAMAFAQGALQLFLAWAVMGLAMAIGLYETAFATLATTYGPAARGPITGIALLAGFASTVGWPLSTALEAWLGWRGACMVWAGLHMTLGLGLNLAFVPAGSHFALAAPADKPPLQEKQEQQEQQNATAKHRTQNTSTAMVLLAFVFSATWFVSTAMAAHLPRMLEIAGAGTTMALFAAMLVGPAQVVARIAEFGLMARFHPLASARLAALSHPLGAAALLIFGAPAAVVFALLHGAGNGILTIAKGTLPLAIFGPQGYGLRQGYLVAPARFAQAAAPLAFGLMLDTWGMAAIMATAAVSLLSFAALVALKPGAS